MEEELEQDSALSQKLSNKINGFKFEKVRIVNIDNRKWLEQRKRPETMKGKEAYVLGKFCEGFSGDSNLPSLCADGIGWNKFFIADLLETTNIQWFYKCITKEGEQITLHESEIEFI